MQPRVEDDRLPSNHADPSDAYQRRVEVGVRDQVQVFQKVADRVQCDAPSRDDQTPEIKTLPPPKSPDDHVIEFEDIVKGDAAEDQYRN